MAAMQIQDLEISRGDLSVRQTGLEPATSWEVDRSL